MDKQEIKKYLTTGYFIFSGVYLTYTFYKYFKQQVRRQRNSLARSEIISAIRHSKDHPHSIAQEDSQNVFNDNNINNQNRPREESKQLEKKPNRSHRGSECNLEENPKKNKIKSKTNSQLNLAELDSILPPVIVDNESRKIIKICLTGGPCAGKTSGLAFLTEKMRDDDFNVYVVPEAATLISNGGGMLDLGNFTEEEIIYFQQSLMKVQISLEDEFYKIAQLSQCQSILLCDRGLLDGKAFMTEQMWQRLLKSMKFSEQDIRDRRYDSVIHMITAADGAAEHYIQEGARFQNLEEAQDIDKKFQEAWLGHQRFEIIDNKSVSSFEEKLEKLLFTVRRMSGVPVKGQKLYLRYIILDPLSHPNIPSSFPVETFEIEDTYLYNAQHDENKGKLTKIRKRIQNNEIIYLCSESHIIDGIQTMYYKKRLDFREYILVKDREDRDRKTIKKIRRQFVYEGYFYSLDKYLDFNMCILRIKNSSGIDEDKVIIPEFLQIDADISNQKEFKSINLSLKESPLRDYEFLQECVNALYEQQKSFIKFEDKLRPRNNKK